MSINLIITKMTQAFFNIFHIYFNKFDNNKKLINVMQMCIIYYTYNQQTVLYNQ